MQYPATSREEWAKSLTAKAEAISAVEKVLQLSSESNRDPATSLNPGAARVVEVILQPEQLVAVEAWRAANMKTSIEAAISELVSRALLDEIADTATLLEAVRAHLKTRDCTGSSN